MLNGIGRPIRRFVHLIPGGTALLTVAVVGVMFYAGCTGNGGSEAPLGLGLGAGEEYYGPETLEERIAGADAIARVRLISVSAVAEQQSGETDYIAALDHRFRVVEYLRGSGSNELVAVVYDTGESFSSSETAIARANTLKNRRDTQWDDREAIVFLEDAHPELPSSRRADRYRLGAISFYRPHDDYYTIASRWEKRWLPAASAGGASGDSGTSGGGAQRFLLDAPAPADAGAGGASGQAESTPTITLTEMKANIAEIERQVTAGGGSKAYRDCLHLKYEWEREVRYMKEQEHYKKGFFDKGRDYFYIRHDNTIGSGLPAGARAFTDPIGGEGDTAPVGAGDFPIMGSDSGQFNTKWPGVADTVRPLPAREYKFYYSYRPQPYVICDGQPEEEKKREEVFVTVTAPAGTVHEAFFDPATIGQAVGADGSNGVLKPVSFTAGGTATALQGLKWENGSVVLTLSPYTALTGNTIDFIALDGSLALSLGASDAMGDSAAGTLTWSVSEQPWQAGDKLMLRIRQDAPTPTPNRAPAFKSASYSFSVAENAGSYDVVGVVSASDPDTGDVVTYYITAGNDAGKFNITHNAGEIVALGSLDYETASSYSLTVEARDGNGGKGTATVAISVTDVAE